jgi:hypothetical protein
MEALVIEKSTTPADGIKPATPAPLVSEKSKSNMPDTPNKGNKTNNNGSKVATPLPDAQYAAVPSVKPMVRNLQLDGRKVTTRELAQILADRKNFNVCWINGLFKNSVENS